MLLLNILQHSSFSNQRTSILYIQCVLNLPGRGFRQRITLTSSVPMTLNDVIVHVRQFVIALVSVDGCSGFPDPDGFLDMPVATPYLFCTRCTLSLKPPLRDDYLAPVISVICFLLFFLFLLLSVTFSRHRTDSHILLELLSSVPPLPSCPPPLKLLSHTCS